MINDYTEKIKIQKYEINNFIKTYYRSHDYIIQLIEISQLPSYLALNIVRFISKKYNRYHSIAFIQKLNNKYIIFDSNLGIFEFNNYIKSINTIYYLAYTFYKYDECEFLGFCCVDNFK